MVKVPLKIFVEVAWKQKIKVVFLLLLVLWPFLYITTTINDDAFVYYTYAKNFARGNFFAYDPREFASEGFTSIAYLLLLVPFELARIPLPLAALLINMCSIFGAAILCCKIFEVMFPSKVRNSYWVGFAFLFACFLDTNVTVLMGWGLETLLNIPACFGFIYGAVLLFRWGKTKDFNLLLFAYAMSVLVRPENLLLGFPWIVLGFFSLSSKRKGAQSVAVFLLVGLAFLSWKYCVFKDLLPTGFYRKMSGQSIDVTYLKSYLSEYSLVFQPVYWIGIVSILLQPELFRNNSLLKKTGLAGVLMFIGLAMFILRIEPIQGYFQRYLTIATLGMYLVGASLFALIIPARKSVNILFAVVMITVLFSGVKQKQRSSPFLLHREVLKQLESNPYVMLGRYLQKNVEHPEEISLMFGDAGSIPYFFDCKFVDINGLTEPAIAKMFKGGQRKEKVTEYVSRQKLDMAVLAVENKWLNLGKDSQRLPQGPLKSAGEYAHLLRQMRKDGFVYAGTIHASDYELHFGLNRNSPRFSDLKQVLSEYISMGTGFVKETDLVLEFSTGNLRFENIVRVPQSTEKQGDVSKTL